MTGGFNPLSSPPRSSPWAELRSVAYQTFIYQKMVKAASPDAKPGASVTVYDRRGNLFGHGLYNPRSQIAVRMLNFDDTPIDAAFWRRGLERAVTLRAKTLRLDAGTDAYRLVYSEGDDLSGLVVDRYADTLSVELFSLGMWRAIDELLPILHELTGTRHHHVHADARAQQHEGFRATPLRSADAPAAVNIVENGVRFRVQFDGGHKTGFFCDQRENRHRLARLVKDADVLDLCSYTGGFGLYAKVLGGAASVTCVDLDEQAVELARRNANLNQVRIDTVQADAFAYMRQMQANGRRYDVVALDPPKFIFGRKEATAEGGCATLDSGRWKYSDLNRLAAALVKPDGLLLTCSCSGALGRDAFVELVVSAVRQAGRSCQILDVTGAGPDHPVSPRCPESSYLKAVWLRVG